MAELGKEFWLLTKNLNKCRERWYITVANIRWCVTSREQHLPMLKNSSWYQALMSVQADSQGRSSSPDLVTVFCCSFSDVWICTVPKVYGIIQLGLPWAREIMLVSTISFWNWHFYCSLDAKPLAKKELSWWCVVTLFRDSHHTHVPMMIVCRFLSVMVSADSIFPQNWLLLNIALVNWFAGMFGARNSDHTRE